MPDTFRVEMDTTHLRFNPNDHRFYKKICEEIPAFGEYISDFAGMESTRKRIYAWIVVMYDVNTPLRREVKDLYKRKIYAANLCGFKPNKTSGKFKDYVERILTGQDKDINDLIVKFIASFSSPEYTQLMAHVAIQYSMLEKIIRGETDKNIQQIFDTATDKIKELTNLIYGTGERDEVYEARRALYKQVAYDLSDMRPESVARTIAKDGVLPDEWSPYGEGYMPDDIHFVGDDVDIAREDEESV